MLPTDIVSVIPKPVLFLGYALTATTLCLMPVIAAAASLGQRRAWLAARVGRIILASLFALLFVGCFWFGHGADGFNLSVVALAVAVLFSFVSGKFDRLVFAAIFTTLFVSRMLLWWRQAVGPLSISPWESIQIAILLVLISAVLNEFGPFGEPRRGAAQKNGTWVRGALVAALLLVAALMSFARAMEATLVNAYGAWHHWSVYVAAVDLLRSGAVPMRDFALQYGLGPTLLIDALASDDPFSLMATLTSLMLFFQTALVTAIVWVIVDARRNTLYFAIALLGCSGACLTWIAWPPELASAAIAPSVSGMRYVPVLIQTLFILLVAQRIQQRRLQLAGHVIWALASIWAPELFFYATAIWGPYFLWQKSTLSGRFSARQAVYALLELGAVVLITSGIFLALFWWRYATLPTWYGYIAYLVNEPDPVNLAVRGVVWTLVVMLLLFGVSLFFALRTRPRDGATRNLFVTLCLSLATLSIFIGRSNENNFLVILPFFLLTVLCAAAASSHVWVKRALYAFFACSIAYWPVFNWSPWVDFVHVIRDQGLSGAFDRERLVNELNYMTPEGQAVLLEHRPERMAKRVDPADAARAITAITAQYGEPITVYDINFVMLNGPVSRGWSAIQDPAAFIPLSPKRRLEFIKATAQRLKQPGWFVFNRIWLEGWSRSRGLLDDMDTAYDEDKQLDFGSYYAIRFVPRAASTQSQPGTPQSK